MGATDREWYGAKGEPEDGRTRSPRSAFARRIAKSLVTVPETVASRAAIDRWIDAVSIPALLSSRMVWALCLAFAAPIFARLRHRPHAWAFHGDAKACMAEALTVAECLYGGLQQMKTESWISLWRSAADDLGTDPSGHGDLLIISSALNDRLTKAEVAARLWLDGAPETFRRPSAAVAMFTSEHRFDPKLVRARWGGGKLWVMSVPADAGGDEGIFDQRPKDGKAAAAVLAVAAMQSTGETGVAWLRFVNWCGDDLPAMLANDIADGAEADVAPETALQSGDVARLFAMVAGAGEFATSQGLTGWPAGAAIEAGQKMAKAWHQSNLQLLSKRGGR